MNEDAFNTSIRKFLKQVGVTSQREVEEAVRKSGQKSGTIEVRATLVSEEIGLNHIVRGRITLG